MTIDSIVGVGLLIYFLAYGVLAFIEDSWYGFLRWRRNRR